MRPLPGRRKSAATATCSGMSTKNVVAYSDHGLSARDARDRALVHARVTLRVG